MHVAGLRIRPGIEDRNHRAALPFLRRIAHLHGARAMAKRPEIVWREPACAAQRIWTFAVFRHGDTLSPDRVMSQAVHGEQGPRADRSGEIYRGPAFSERSDRSCYGPTRLPASASRNRSANSALRYGLLRMIDFPGARPSLFSI